MLDRMTNNGVDARIGTFGRLDDLTPLEALGSLHAAFQITDDIDLAEVMHHLERLFRES